MTANLKLVSAEVDAIRLMNHPHVEPDVFFSNAQKFSRLEISPREIEKTGPIETVTSLLSEIDHALPTRNKRFNRSLEVRWVSPVKHDVTVRAEDASRDDRLPLGTHLPATAPLSRQTTCP